MYAKLGFTRAHWKRLKAEARAVMINTANNQGTITYSQIGSQLSTPMDGDDPRLWEIIGDVARDEEHAGRGLLSAVVVREDRNLPGDGFYALAEYFGRQVSDRAKCFGEELARLHHEWSSPHPGGGGNGSSAASPAIPSPQESSLKMMPGQSCWVIKCREVLEDGRKGWHWRAYFGRTSDNADSVYRWGGPMWIRNALSRKLIRDRFRAGDLVLCYQVDTKHILGITRLSSGGLKVKAAWSAFDLAPPSSAYVLQPPLYIDDLRATGCTPAAFTRKFRGTVLEIKPGDLQGIMAAIVAQSPDEEQEFLAWLEAAGVGDGSRPVIRCVFNTEFPAENADPAPADLEDILASLEEAFSGRDDIYVKRKMAAIIRRDGPLIRALKAKYRHQCQFPGCTANIPKKNGGIYCEVAHIQPVAAGGNARRINLVVLCPNHHKMIDYGDTTILENTGSALTLRLNGDTVTISR